METIEREKTLKQLVAYCVLFCWNDRNYLMTERKISSELLKKNHNNEKTANTREIEIEIDLKRMRTNMHISRSFESIKI